MFTYQQNTHFSQAVSCGREEFWQSVRNAQNQWRIDSRRAILEAVEKHDGEAIGRWLKQTDYEKFLAKKRAMKKDAARQRFFQKSDEERLLAFAQEQKDNLTAFIFCCREFDETATAKGGMFRHRRLADCHLNGLVMLDIDHVENPLEVFETLKGHQELMARTALVHITSSKKGIRIVFTANLSDGNLADNQIVFAQALGFKADQSCIDATRNSFTPKEEDILYLNESLLFDYYDEEYDRVYTPMYREKKTTPSRPTSDPTLGSLGSWKGIPIQAIIDARYGDKLPCAADSNRHNESLKLASDLLVMFDGDKRKTLQVLQMQPWVREIIEERDENVEQTVNSAAERMLAMEKKFGPSLKPSKPMQDAIESLSEGSVVGSPGVGSSPLPLGGDGDGVALAAWGTQIEQLFDDFPLLRDVCKGLKRSQYPAALIVAGAFGMTLMTRCTYRFYHRPEELRRLNCSALIIGDPASGKSFATRLYKLLTAPIMEADKPGREAINAYREQMRTKGANKEKPKKPKAVVRIHPARTSNAQFIQDMVNAVENVDGEEMHLHMLTFDTELDNTVTVQKGGSWIDKQSLELKAFHNEEDGQSYSNNDSIMQDFNVYWNYVYTGTPMALKKKVNIQNFGSGLATRLTCIPLPATNFEMMSRERNVDYESDVRLNEWAARLDKTKGLLPLDKIVDELYEWTARRMADAKENNSRADEMLLKRCAYHGLNYAVPFIVMRHWDSMTKDGDFWCASFETDDTDWRLAELIVNMQFACQRHFFGAMAETYFDNQHRDASVNVQRRQKTQEGFQRLPEEFTTEDVVRCFNLGSEGSARKKVTRLQRDHLIEKVREEKGHDKALFRKTGVILL